MYNLTNCDVEPIHIPGQIQSHGFLLVIDKNFIIRYQSDNISSYLTGIAENLLGMHVNHIMSVIGENEPPDFLSQLISLGKTNGFEQTNPFSTDIKGRPFYLVISRTGDYFALEFEPAVADTTLDMQKAIGHSIAGMLTDKNLESLLKNSADQIKKLIQFDRVMVYRFAEDGHGEVVAESKNENLEPWLGLHYPATDIPKPARELYKINLTRLIADVESEPAKLLADSEAANEPLDMTHFQLRAVSSIHIQYLKNMGVCSSFSVSLIYKKELWGLIACHSYSPKFIDYKSRESAKLIGQILSSALEFRQDEENQLINERYKSSVDKLSNYMLKEEIETALTRHDITLLDVVDASGAVIKYDNNLLKLGKTPADDQIEKLIQWHESAGNPQFYYTDEITGVNPQAEEFRDIAAGVMISTLSYELSEHIIWFKPEIIQNIKWAGAPEKTGTRAENGLLMISPRQSFDEWSETVSGKSKAWSNEEIKSAMRLKTEVIAAINQKAGEIRLLNEKLKQAYEELDTFSYTISHDLKNPLSAVKSYAQIILRDDTLSARTKEFLNRILAGANKMNKMIDEVLDYSRIGRSALNSTDVDPGLIITDLVRDLSLTYKAENLKVTVGKTPLIKGDPMMISQVFANLLSNAIKYSSKEETPEVSIESTEDENLVTYIIRDNGIGIDIKELPYVFDLFRRMENVNEIEGTGVGLAIVKRIVEKHQGKIWVDSELNKGTAFYVAFKK